jgi:Zn-dependent M28 family amino/carboxypeptidase
MLEKKEELHGLIWEKERAVRSKSLVKISIFLLVILLLSLSSFSYFSSRNSRSNVAIFLVDENINLDANLKKFQSLPDRQHTKKWFREITSYPHVAGTKNGERLANWTRDMFLEFGMENAFIEKYYPLLNYPVRQAASIVYPPELVYNATLTEDIFEEDEDSKKFHNMSPPFHGYSKDGDVTGNLVYVNYGTLRDFQLLKDSGVSFDGKIALVRYGYNFRGLKVRAAEIFGCSGILIFSDPLDDGYRRGNVYPEGPWRPDQSLQRGSVHFNSIFPGDPLTPGIAATLNATRIPMEESKVLPKIPSLPISYRDAKVFLQALKGHGSFLKDWQGALDVEYWSGPCDTIVNLVNRVDYSITPIFNVMSVIEGIEKDRFVIIGNHRDAWYFFFNNRVAGAVDPGSGTAALFEVVRSFGILLKSGWKPQRSIIIASWDGEEYGMVGSTEYVENYAKTLNASAVAYVNVDTGVSGPLFRPRATPSLSGLIRSVTMLVNDPSGNGTVFDVWKRNARTTIDRIFPTVNQLGSGSDFAGFVDYLGIATLDFSFRVNVYGASNYGSYHSIYDSYHYFTKFIDPNFDHVVTAAVIWGSVVLRLTDSHIVPFDYFEYSIELSFYASLLEERYKELFKKDLTLWNLRKSIKNLGEAAKSLENEVKGINCLTSKSKIRSINDRLIFAERKFLGKGIKGREWFKHVVFAPGLWAGYGAQTFPELLEALETGNDKEIEIVENEMASFVNRVAEYLME